MRRRERILFGPRDGSGGVRHVAVAGLVDAGRRFGDLERWVRLAVTADSLDDVLGVE